MLVECKFRVMSVWDLLECTTGGMSQCYYDITLEKESKELRGLNWLAGRVKSETESPNCFTK
jgi:hypothetical protein